MIVTPKKCADCCHFSYAVISAYDGLPTDPNGSGWCIYPHVSWLAFCKAEHANKIAVRNDNPMMVLLPNCPVRLYIEGITELIRKVDQ